jgi:hypothetical protein
MAVLNEATWEKVREMFPSGQDSEVAKLLQTECGNNLPFPGKRTLTDWSAFVLQRST